MLAVVFSRLGKDCYGSEETAGNERDLSKLKCLLVPTRTRNIASLSVGELCVNLFHVCTLASRHYTEIVQRDEASIHVSISTL